MKDFVHEFQKFVQKVLDGDFFALSRFADGEGCIIRNMGSPQGGWLDRQRVSASWKHIPGAPPHEKFRERLISALEHNQVGYYVGLPCSADHGPQYSHLFKELKSRTRVPEEQLTFARLFHSYNYPRFKSEFLPAALSHKKVFLICNERADSSQLPDIVHRWNVSAVNASLNSLSVIDDVSACISEKGIKGGVFLISTGPCAAIIVKELWIRNSENFYIDVGSGMDPIYFKNSPCRGITRTYLEKYERGETFKKPFVWG